MRQIVFVILMTLISSAWVHSSPTRLVSEIQNSESQSRAPAANFDRAPAGEVSDVDRQPASQDAAKRNPIFLLIALLAAGIFGFARYKRVSRKTP